jgi:NADPH2:quinone reductase
MKALLSRTPGGPERLTLEEIPPPSPRANELLIEVHAVGVNYPDVLVIQDLYQFKPPRPFAPGGEISGIVRAVGANAKGFAVGDRVIGLCGAGGMAEQVAIEAAKCMPMPREMSFEEGAAFIFTYGTSQYALKQRAGLRAGETLLVLGAAGGVGLAAVELGKAMGATVVAAASSEEKVAFARAAGADRGVVYPRGPLDREQQKTLSEALKGACGGGADVIYDAVGGAYAEPAFRAINWNGRFLVVGFPAGIPSIPLNLPLLKSAQIVGVFWGAWTARAPHEFAANVRELFALYTAGKVKPRVSARFPLERGAEAIRALGERQALGKVVVTLR